MRATSSRRRSSGRSAPSGFKGQAKFSSWLYRIALNLCRDWIRRERRTPVSQVPEGAGSGRPGGRTRPGRIDRGSGRPPRSEPRGGEGDGGLPEEQRTAIVLKEYHGMTFQEIADLQGCPLSTVKTRLYQGLTCCGDGCTKKDTEAAGVGSDDARDAVRGKGSARQYLYGIAPRPNVRRWRHTWHGVPRAPQNSTISGPCALSSRAGSPPTRIWASASRASRPTRPRGRGGASGMGPGRGGGPGARRGRRAGQSRNQVQQPGPHDAHRLGARGGRGRHTGVQVRPTSPVKHAPSSPRHSAWPFTAP